MDKEWVFLDRRSDEFITGLRAFINNSLLVASFEGKIKCPCPECYNCGWTSPEEVEIHLKVDGMWPDYVNSRWKWHGEALPNIGQPPVGTADIAAMLHDAFGMHCPSHDDNNEEEDVPPQNLTPDAEKFFRMIEEGKSELYPGCGKSKLDFMLQLYQLKTINSWTDVSFTGLLDMLKEWFPEANLPANFYQTRKLVNDLALPYESIDVCPNDCMLFWKTDATRKKCKKCHASRYKSKTGSGCRVAHKVLRYFPLAPRLQRLYMSRHTAESMVWHYEKRPDDEVLRHPADSPAWKHLDSMYPNFASEPRNVRLGLASDGFNPYGIKNLSHSTWPVVMSVYNLPPWLCMKQPYLMLSLLIPGPTSPGKDIDVFLQPLIEELKSLWNEGIPTYDAFKKETFNMHAAVMWTISDFPAYAMLSGWSTKGRLACPHCAFGTKSTRLKHGRKECYLGHRRWLPMAHRYRMFKKPFDGECELDPAPIPMTGEECLDSLHGLKFEKGKGAKKKVLKRRRGRRIKKYTGPWKKKSIFFDLPYWKELLLRHNIDVMHTEKNVTESVLGTLLGTEGKDKDSLNARFDLKELKCKPKYHARFVGGRWVYDPMPFTLKAVEKSLIFEILSLVLLPDGFSSNIAKCVRKAGKKLIGLKSHDLHIIMQYLLPLAIRHSLPKEAKAVLLELSSYFRNLCTKVGTKEHFEDLSSRIAVTLCHLEKLMPPSFFDVMVHLTVHLADEAKIAGPVQFRWMYPIERYLYTLKKYVRNRGRPEGSIAVGYIIEETLGFCALYFENMIPPSGSLFVGLNEHSETDSQVSSRIPDDDEFIRMMDMGSAYKNNSERRQLSPHIVLNEPACLQTPNPTVGSEVPVETNLRLNEANEQRRNGAKRKRKTRKARGKNKPKFGLHGKEKLLFNAVGQPVAPDDKVAQLGRFIGQLVAECSNFPLNAPNWAEICKSKKVDEAWGIVKDTLDFTDPATESLKANIKDVIEEKLHARWTSFKSSLKTKWYTPYKGMERRFVCGNKHVHPGQWRALVNRWDEAKNQEVAEINAINRQQLRMHQTTGTKTYAQLRYKWECEHPGEVLDRVTFFELVHSSNKKDPTNPQASNEEAQKKLAELKELENEVRIEGGEVTHEVRDELFCKVMGPETRNRVRGYGIGVKWSDVPGIVTQKNGIKHQLKALSEAYEVQHAANEKREADLSLKLKESAEREEALQGSLRIMNKKLDSLQARVGANQLTEIFAAAGINSMESLDFGRLLNLIKKPDSLQANCYADEGLTKGSGLSSSTC